MTSAKFNPLAFEIPVQPIFPLSTFAAASVSSTVASPRLTARVLLLYLSLALPTMIHAEQTIPATSGRVTIEGRVERNETSTTAGYPGVVWRVIVTGTTLTMDVETTTNTVKIDLIVDDGQPKAIGLNAGRQTIKLFDRSGEETSSETAGRMVEIYKRTESWQGLMTVHGFATDGRFSQMPSAKDRRLLFVGDSITAGSGTDALVDDPTEDDAATSNGRLSFARAVGNRLDAQVHLVAYGGRGLVRDWQGIHDTNNAPQFFPRTLPDDSSSRWDAGLYQPHGVCVCLGTNDFHLGIPDRDGWVAAMVRFIHQIRDDHPAVPVILLSSPMHARETAVRQSHLQYLREAAKVVGDGVWVLEVEHYPGRPVDSHPIGIEHAAMAESLEPSFREILGW